MWIILSVCPQRSSWGPTLSQGRDGSQGEEDLKLEWAMLPPETCRGWSTDLWLQTATRNGDGEWLLMSFFWEWWNFLELESSDGCTILQILKERKEKKKENSWIKKKKKKQKWGKSSADFGNSWMCGLHNTLRPRLFPSAALLCSGWLHSQTDRCLHSGAPAALGLHPPVSEWSPERSSLFLTLQKLLFSAWLCPWPCPWIRHHGGGICWLA